MRDHLLVLRVSYGKDDGSSLKPIPSELIRCSWVQHLFVQYPDEKFALADGFKQVASVPIMVCRSHMSSSLDGG